MEDEFLSAKEFACLVCMHYNTIIRAIKSGRINAFRVGSGKKAAFRIARSEIGRITLMDMEDLVSIIIEKSKGK